MKQKIYTSAPLPFQGQKRRHVKEFGKIVKQSKASIYVDLFGGSGLLAHTAKRNYPEATVIYNDFDSYNVRLSNVDKTNALLGDLRLILKGYPKDKLVVGKTKDLVIQRLSDENIKDYPVDWITISSSLLFSMNYALSFAEFERQSLYNCIRTSDYSVSGYLDGLEIVSMDYKDLFNHYKNVPDVVFLIDPPYLSTDVSTYNSGSYWNLKDYLDVLNTLKGVNYVFFTSNKSNIIELAEWIECNLNAINPFNGAIRKEIVANMNYSSKYIDIMLYKIINKPSKEGLNIKPFVA